MNHDTIGTYVYAMHIFKHVHQTFTLQQFDNRESLVTIITTKCHKMDRK